jgi:cytochrome c556
MSVRTITLAIAVAVALGAIAPSAFAACTREQATQKMGAVANGLGQKAGQAKTAEDSQKIQSGYARLNEGGDAMAKQDFNKACQIYDGIAKDFDLKL